MDDLSFLRLEPIFNDAKYTRASTATSIFYLGQIILRPNETYLQTTNTKLGIAFNGNFKVTIVDCNDKELQNITNKVAINERTINGLPQIDFEIVNIGVDYYAKTVFLKFQHTVSNYVWWSNPINITNYFDNISSRFDYKDATDTYYQSIVLKCFFSVNDAESNSSEYTTQYGKKVTSRLIATEMEQYFFDSIDNFTFRRLNYLLGQNVIYLNGNRVTTKQTLPSKARVGDSNIFNIDFKVPVDYNETYSSELQIFPQFDLIGKYPFGSYTLSGLNNDIIGSFNRLYTLGSGTIRLYKDSALLKTYVVAEITEAGFDFLADISSVIVANGSYYINIDSGLFISDFNEVYQGITNTTDWAFEITNGEFSNTDFNNEFLLN
jgi:hypothetical protein